MIYFGTDAVGTKKGVDRKGEVQRGGIGRHGFDFTFWGEHDDLFGEEVEFDGVEQVECVGLWVVKDFFYGV